ncbi:hypothetical protein JL720_5867 [Aureococcus anophagefferens]|nr:hypothetical protein JL720_5867 [Aureococcus anophagefferens]
MDDDDGDGDDPTIIIDVSAWPRVSFARAEERLFEADGAPAASFDAAGARGEAAYAAAFRRAFAALGAAPEDAPVVAAADAARDGARAACAAAALGDLRCRRAAAGAAWCGLLGHCTQVEPQAGARGSASSSRRQPSTSPLRRLRSRAAGRRRPWRTAPSTRRAPSRPPTARPPPPRAVVDAVRAFRRTHRATTAAVVVDQDGGDDAARVAAALADMAPGCYKVAVRAAPPGAALRGAFWLDHFARRGAGGGYLAREAFDDLVAGPDGAAGLARRFVDY